MSEAERFSDEEIQNLIQKTQGLFSGLKLSREELSFAIKEGDAAHSAIVAAYQNLSDEALGRTRAIAAAAALAYAMIKTDPWARALDEDFPKK